MLRAGRVVGRLLRSAGDVVFLEPCRDWAGCHVWKLYSARDIFSQEQGAGDQEGGGEVSRCLDRDMACYLLSTYLKVIEAAKADRMAYLQNLGITNQEEIAEYSLKFYYTNQVDLGDKRSAKCD